MRLLSTAICKAVLNRPDGIDLMGVTYGVTINRFPIIFKGYIIVLFWELDMNKHKTYVVISKGKQQILTVKMSIPKRHKFFTTSTITLSIPPIRISSPAGLIVDIYLDEDIVFSFPFYFLPPFAPLADKTSQR